MIGSMGKKSDVLFLLCFLPLGSCNKHGGDKEEDFGRSISILLEQPRVFSKNEFRVKFDFPMLELAGEELMLGHRDMSLSSAWHVLLYFGLDSRLPRNSRFNNSSQILDTILDARKHAGFFSERVLVKTKHGVRFVTSRKGSTVSSGESHRDQSLANLGMLGVSTNVSIYVQGETHTVADALNDSMANFNLQQKEIAWSCIAYFYYLDLRRSFQNKFNQDFDFSKIVNELLNRDISRESCGGLHMYFALSLAKQVNDSIDILGSSQKTALEEGIELRKRMIFSLQQEDGSWVSVNNTSRVSNSIENQLIITSHIVDFFTVSDVKEELEYKAIGEAIKFLSKAIQNVDKEFKSKYFCPFVHSLIQIRDGKAPN